MIWSVARPAARNISSSGSIDMATASSIWRNTRSCRSEASAAAKFSASTSVIGLGHQLAAFVALMGGVLQRLGQEGERAGQFPLPRGGGLHGAGFGLKLGLQRGQFDPGRVALLPHVAQAQLDDVDRGFQLAAAFLAVEKARLHLRHLVHGQREAFLRLAHFGRAAVVELFQLAQPFLHAQFLALRLFADIAGRDRVDQEDGGDDDGPADEEAQPVISAACVPGRRRMNRVPSSDFRNSRCSGRWRSSITWMRVVSREVTVSASCPQLSFFASMPPRPGSLVDGVLCRHALTRDQACPGDRTA
jgi:hypothetical protein